MRAYLVKSEFQDAFDDASSEIYSSYDEALARIKHERERLASEGRLLDDCAENAAVSGDGDEDWRIIELPFHYGKKPDRKCATHIADGDDDLRIRGIRGRWHTVESRVYYGNRLWLLEEDNNGDEWPCIIVAENGDVVLDEAWNGWSDLDEQIGTFVQFHLADWETKGTPGIFVRVGWGD